MLPSLGQLGSNVYLYYVGCRYLAISPWLHVLRMHVIDSNQESAFVIWCSNEGSSYPG